MTCRECESLKVSPPGPGTVVLFWCMALDEQIALSLLCGDSVLKGCPKGAEGGVQ